MQRTYVAGTCDATKCVSRETQPHARFYAQIQCVRPITQACRDNTLSVFILHINLLTQILWWTFTRFICINFNLNQSCWIWYMPKLVKKINVLWILILRHAAPTVCLCISYTNTDSHMQIFLRIHLRWLYTRTKLSREIRTTHEWGVSPTYKGMQARINNAQSTFVVHSP